MESKKALLAFNWSLENEVNALKTRGVGDLVLRAGAHLSLRIEAGEVEEEMRSQTSEISKVKSQLIFLVESQCWPGHCLASWKLITSRVPKWESQLLPIRLRHSYTQKCNHPMIPPHQPSPSQDSPITSFSHAKTMMKQFSLANK